MAPSPTLRRRLAGALLVGLLASCSGNVSAPSGANDSDMWHVDEGDPAASERFEPAPATLHRLTVAEYRNSVHDLLGAGLSLSTELEPDTALKGFTSIGASELTIAQTTAEKLEAAALELTAQVFADAERRVALVGCEPASSGDACVGEFIARFGRRAFRRPLESAELADMKALAVELDATLGDVWESLSYVVAAFLESPDFVFRVEVGEPDPDVPSRLRHTSLEMASRLSYVLWQSMPDDTLLAAGERGDLLDREAVRREAERMMGEPRFRQAMQRFFSENLALERLDNLSKESAVFPQMSATLPSAMRAELMHMFEHVVFTTQGDFRDLFDSRTRFVNGELAALYGIPDVSGDEFVAVDMPADSARVGLLGSAGLLAIYATTTNTSPTRRGKFVRNRLLCQEIPSPPPGTDTTLPEADASQTMRERLTLHRTDPVCAGCHIMMDPLGLSLESFDGLGVHRETDRGRPLDLTGTIDGKAFDGPAELAGLLREHANAGPCVVQQLYRFATGHQESSGERVVLRELAARFAEHDYRLPALVLELVSSDGFRFASSAN
jgi:hypothetical protein